jgi:hypothetical protein
MIYTRSSQPKTTARALSSPEITSRTVATEDPGEGHDRAVNSETQSLPGSITMSVLASNLELATNGKLDEARTGPGGAVS